MTDSEWVEVSHSDLRNGDEVRRVNEGTWRSSGWDRQPTTRYFRRVPPVADPRIATASPKDLAVAPDGRVAYLSSDGWHWRDTGTFLTPDEIRSLVLLVHDNRVVNPPGGAE